MTPIVLDLPGGPVEPHHLVLDFTGTLSLDGALLPGVAEAISSLAEHLTVIVMTADTFGTAREALAGLPVEIRIIGDGQEKAGLVSELGGAGTVAVGNGRNDVPMMAVAALGIAVMGPEGAATELLAAADIVTRDIREALGLLAHPTRLRATLRD